MPQEIKGSKLSHRVAENERSMNYTTFEQCSVVPCWLMILLGYCTDQYWQSQSTGEALDQPISTKRQQRGAWTLRKCLCLACSPWMSMGYIPKWHDIRTRRTCNDSPLELWGALLLDNPPWKWRILRSKLLRFVGGFLARPKKRLKKRSSYLPNWTCMKLFYISFWGLKGTKERRSLTFRQNQVIKTILKKQSNQPSPSHHHRWVFVWTINIWVVSLVTWVPGNGGPGAVHWQLELLSQLHRSLKHGA